LAAIQRNEEVMTQRVGKYKRVTHLLLESAEGQVMTQKEREQVRRSLSGDRHKRDKSGHGKKANA
jgi:hypothetical protein